MLRLRPLARTALVLSAALLTGCGGQEDVPRPPAAPAPVTSGAGATDGPVEWAAHAARLTPPEHGTVTEAGVSLARRAGGYRFYLWETSKGKVCTAQVTDSGVAREIACGNPAEAAPVRGSKLAGLVGPGTGFAEWYVMVAVAPGAEVTSVEHEGKVLSWTHVRTLSPATTGRDVYYVTLPDRTYGRLDVTLKGADGRLGKDRLQL
ncbi:hypothetical protein [Streptomyces aureus]|uniref:hypothetical protein n=1 Tax=Streptomyces aureus TaxID=193461 RepID=UPI000A6FAB03|nr:hypothetical protein [Streptomyces aureus]